MKASVECARAARRNCWALIRFAVFGVTIVCWLPATVSVAGETIYLQPGQCIMVGSQQVCALKSDVKDGKGDAAAASPAPGDVNYVCRYGEHKGGDLPGYRTYGLVKVTTRADGKFSEILIKDFGIKGKEKCEQAAEDRRK